MNKWAELLLGLILLIGAILVAFYSSNLSGQAWVWRGVVFNFGSAAWTVLKGGIWWFVAMLGLLLILLGISDLRE